MTINQELINRFNQRYQDNPTNQAVESAIAKVGINDASLNNNTVRSHPFVFSDETKRGDMYESEVKWQMLDVRCSQYSSGRYDGDAECEDIRVFPKLCLILGQVGEGELFFR